MKLCGSTPSAVLVVGLLHPPHHSRISARTWGEFNWDGHGLVNPRRPQRSAGLSPFEPEPEIDPVFWCLVDPGRGPPGGRGARESFGLPGRGLAKPHRRIDEGVEDGPELRSIRILTVDELIRRREEEVRISESLHDQERLCVAGHALLREPSAKFVLVVESFSFDASIPLVDPFACAFLEEANRHVLHPLPITRLRHRHNPFKRLRRLSNPTEKVSEDSREPPKSSGCRQDPFEISLLSRRAVSRGGLRVFLLDLGEKGLASRTKSASLTLISSAGLSFSTDLSGGSWIPEPAEFGHPGSLSICSLLWLNRIELQTTRTSFNGLPSLPSMPVSRCTNMYSSLRTRLLKKVVSNSLEPDFLKARTSASIFARHAST